jgi:hypothetical protein
MNNKLQVFISSTYLDLKEERQAAVEAILKSGNLPAGMELFTAGNKSQWEVIQRWITDSDIYMLILGGRYGSVESNSGLSYTELEYDFAVSSGKPFFAVVIEEDALEIKVKAVGSSVLEKDNPAKLKEFREKVLSKMSSFFSDTKDVKLSVLETIPQLEAEFDLKGWIRAETIPDTKALADELSRLHTENKKLTDKVTTLSKRVEKPKSATAPEEKEFDELRGLLLNIMVDISSSKHAFDNGDELPDKVSLMDLAFSCKDKLMTGITNEFGMSDLDQFIFFTLCPKLQAYELVLNEKVTGAKYRRYAATKKGMKFFAYLEKRIHQNKTPTEASPPKAPAKKKAVSKKAPVRKRTDK